MLLASRPPTRTTVMVRIEQEKVNLNSRTNHEPLCKRCSIDASCSKNITLVFQLNGINQSS